LPYFDDEMGEAEMAESEAMLLGRVTYREFASYRPWAFSDDQGGRFFRSLQDFSEWAMLGSNQRPPPCESRATACWGFPELSKCLQIAVFLLGRFSQHFSRFTRVAARLLHN
jgi:hypothetical protein